MPGWPIGAAPAKLVLTRQGAGFMRDDSGSGRRRDQGKAVPNPRFVAWKGGSTTREIADQVTADDGYRKSAAHLLIDSPFNINSTRVDVWEALLASAFGAEVPASTAGTVGTSVGDATIPVNRHLPSVGEDLESRKDPVSRDIAKWNGYRRLEPAQRPFPELPGAVGPPGGGCGGGGSRRGAG